MRELIYKDEAYKAIDNCICDGWYRISPTEAKMNIRHLVSDANRLQGEWMVRDDNTYCSECGASEDTFVYGSEYWHGLGLSHYCPNCGVKMKVIKR